MSSNWAVCIGINDYYNLQPLSYAVQDAASLRDFFTEQRFQQVYYFADDSPPVETLRGPMPSEPSFALLKRFFRERFERPFLNPGDNLWLFFAGHGELHNGHDYLMPKDVDPGDIAGTALKLSDITARLRNCGADNVVVLLDACRSQGSRQGRGIGTEEQPGLVTVYSCSPNEASYEIEALGHGSFTQALLEGLTMKGGQNCATVERLDQHLRYRVPELNQRHNRPVQTPYTAVEPISKNHLILLPQVATLQDVQALKLDAYEASAVGNLDLAKQLWIRVLAASPADQQAVTALERIAVRRLTETAPGPANAPTAATRSVAAPTSGQLPRPAAPTFEFKTVTITGIEKAGLFGLGSSKVITQTHQRKAEYRREELGGGVTLDLVAIPGGTFVMGSPNSEEGRDWYGDFVEELKGVNVEGPQHKVKVSAFWMGKYPVTQAQWRAVAALSRVDSDLDAAPSNFTGDDRPVEQVSWNDAVEFCRRLSRYTRRDYRLPSEAEWEYACRAETTTPFYFGPTITTDLANYAGIDGKHNGKTYPGSYGQGPKGNYRQQTTDVGSFPPNAFGLYDMHGNVWEWCLDDWHNSYEGAPDSSVPCTEGGEESLKLLRGGSWGSNPWYCRSAYRGRHARGAWYDSVGFRVVCASSWTF